MNSHEPLQASWRSVSLHHPCNIVGFKAFHSAVAIIAGIETAHMIRKGQIAANGATAFQTFAELAA